MSAGISMLPPEFIRNLSPSVPACLVCTTKSAEAFVELLQAFKLTTPLPFPSVNMWIPVEFVAAELLAFPIATSAFVPVAE